MESKNSKGKRVIALIGVVILLLMIVATFVVALLPFPGSDSIFMGLVVADGVVPVLLWFYLYIYDKAKKADEKAAKEAEKAEETK